MIRGLLAIGVILVLSQAAEAASATVTKGGSPIQVTADTFVVNEAKGQAIFEGNVVIVRDGLTVWAQQVLVEYGAGGPEDVQTFVATGRVRLKTKDQDATGDKATFNPATQLLHMTGNVVVVNATGTLNGPELTMNLNDNSTVFKGGKGGRVTGTFSTQ